MVAFGLVELQGVHEPVEDAVGDAADAAALETGVVLDADPGEQRDLLAAQPGHAAVGAVDGQAGLVGRDLGAAGGEELADVVLGGHAFHGTAVAADGGVPAGTPLSSACCGVRGLGFSGDVTLAIHAIHPGASGYAGPAHPRAILAIILVSYFLILLDNSVIFTGLPSIGAALDLGATGLSWVQDAYTLVFGGLLLLGARAGRPARTPAGVRRRPGWCSSTASFLIGVAPTGWWLIAGRAMQGVGAADRRAVRPVTADRELPGGRDRAARRGLVRRHRRASAPAWACSSAAPPRSGSPGAPGSSSTSPSASR